MNQKQKKIDIFAQIAAQRTSYRDSQLVEPQPPTLNEVFFDLDSLDPKAAFIPVPKIDNAAKLKRELARYRRSHAKFLNDFAPSLESTRIRVGIDEFDWRIETDLDSKNFARLLNGDGDWKRMTIPHYGGPLGRAVTYYRTEFNATNEMLEKGSVFLCFKAVDYKAHVFVNGSYVGSHEGFFAPFEFDITKYINTVNTLLVKVENDAIGMSNDSWGDDGALYEGDKLYAATGPGYDEPIIGWHHCPPGMGIYQSVYIEARPKIFISDVFIRPILDNNCAEAWIEVYNCHALRHDIQLSLSVYGQNFRARLILDRKFELPGPVGPGLNYFRLPFDLPKPKVWDVDTPWLYQAQLRLLDADGNLLDSAKQQFGMRSFVMDEKSEPKGRFYLNGREIRLRGANTMGFEQQDIMKGDWDQLIDDILLAKICNMNFLRLTQRPVQPEVYDYCDCLGLMTQTDLPLFGVLRRNQFIEAIRQAGEMEKLVRSHPCNIVVSYLNEPSPNALGKPQRHLTRPEMESFFIAASEVVHLMNPDRVIKPVDGDYDPPAPGLPDNHCYNGWYNGHGLDLGKLHKGYWQPVKPGWMYGCGEFGAEGLDFVRLMRKYYPPEWLPQTPTEDRGWTPNSIPQAQTGRFHYMWFDTQHSLGDWVKASQEHQAWIIQLMTEAFRRDSRMNSFAIHLFIDAFPSGWMKTIMDVDRNPKPAYFVYRDALTPLMVNLRCDQCTLFGGEMAKIEAWVCNDKHTVPSGASIGYQLEVDGKVVYASKSSVDLPKCSSICVGQIRVPMPNVAKRTKAVVRIGLFDVSGKTLHEASLSLTVFPTIAVNKTLKICIMGSGKGVAHTVAEELGLTVVDDVRKADTILIDDYEAFRNKCKLVLRVVESGARAVFLDMPIGEYEIADSKLRVEQCGMGDRHFVSRATGHALVNDFEPDDFRFWYDHSKGRVTPLLKGTLDVEDWDEILVAGNGDWASGWHSSIVAAECKRGKGYVRICQVQLAGRTAKNPVARKFAIRLLDR